MVSGASVTPYLQKRFFLLFLFFYTYAHGSPRNIRINTSVFNANGSPLTSAIDVKVIFWKHATSTGAPNKLWDPGVCTSLTPTNGQITYTASLADVDGSTLAGLASSDKIWAEILLGTGGTCTKAMSPRIPAKGSIYAIAADTARRAYSASTLNGNLSPAQAPIMVGATGGSAGTQGLTPAPVAGDETKFLRGDGTWQSAGGGGSGTVSSIDISMPAPWTTTLGPVTTNGILGISAVTPQTVFVSLAGPTSGIADVPTLRSLVQSDLPSLSTSKFTTGTLAVANGGTGGTDATSARIGLGIGSMALQSSTAVNITGGDLSGVTIGSVTPAPATFTGSFQATLADGKIWIGNNVNRSAPVTLSGDVAVTNAGVVSVEKIQGYSVSTATPTDGQIMTWNSTSSTWEPTTAAPVFTWSQLSASDTATLTVNAGFISNRVARMTLTLPASCGLGDKIRVAGLGAGGWKVMPNSGQSIYFNDDTSITGATGFGSTDPKASADFLCTLPNVEWLVTNFTSATTM